MVGISNIGAEAQKVNSVKAEKDRIEKEAFFCTTKELSRLGLEQIPTQFQSHKHLSYTGIQFTGSRRLWREACRSCSARFYYVDRSSGVLWKEYFTDQFYERI